MEGRRQTGLDRGCDAVSRKGEGDSTGSLPGVLIWGEVYRMLTNHCMWPEEGKKKEMKPPHHLSSVKAMPKRG